MTPLELETSYQAKKNIFHAYINQIKKNTPSDLFTIINATLIKNPFTSTFPKRFFENSFVNKNKILFFISRCAKFYIKALYLLGSYLIAWLLYKTIYCKKMKPAPILIDIYMLVDRVNKEVAFHETYFQGAYDILSEYSIPYTIIPRLYKVGKNPFKLIKFFKIINNDERSFLFEFELLQLSDIYTLVVLILQYPFKTLRLLQNEKSLGDHIFNLSLIEDIGLFNFESLTRYIFGKNIAKITNIQRIYSWSEFQVNERSFNYGIRTNNKHIKIYACQFYLNYETYFNTYVDDLDFQQQSSPHSVLVNGPYYLVNRRNVQYSLGVSLRYKDIFTFTPGKSVNTVLLGSYLEDETKHMLESVKELGDIIFKNHPATNPNYLGKLPENIRPTDENIYKLFENSSCVITTASGTAVEAVACGVSVIIIASSDNLTANPLVSHGKDQIWGIAFSKNEIYELYNQLMQYRHQNADQIRQISQWYKDNFFIEPTKENVLTIFTLEETQ